MVGRSKTERTKLCRFAGGGCRNGASCPFAHTNGELQRGPLTPTQSNALKQLLPLLDDEAQFDLADKARVKRVVAGGDWRSKVPEQPPGDAAARKLAARGSSELAASGSSAAFHPPPALRTTPTEPAPPAWPAAPPTAPPTIFAALIHFLDPAKGSNADGTTPTQRIERLLREAQPQFYED